MKITLSTDWLSACGGCHVAIVDLHELILKVLEDVEIKHCPVLTDIKDYPESDLGILTGAVRTAHDRQVALTMREKCDKIIAFGTCAVYGGISGAGSVHGTDEILDAVYINNKTTVMGEIPHDNIPPLEETVTPVDEVIDVDLYLPGCPPHPYFIFKALDSLLQNTDPGLKRHSVCAKCDRLMTKSGEKKLKRFSEGIADDTTCFLSQGYLCFGSVTLDRCLSPCPTHGMTCTGCCGPTEQILREPNRDIRTELAERMALLTEIRAAEIVAVVEKFAKTHYSYAMSSPMIGNKPTFLIKKWIKQQEDAPHG